MKKLYCFGIALLSYGACLQLVAANPEPGSWRGQSIDELNGAGAGSTGWQIVNDGVMGGLSQGNLEYTDAGTMLFSGTLSLENNGGFSLAQTGKVDLNLSNDLGLLLKVRGDGRTYQARLISDARFRGMEVSFSGEFDTVQGEWQQVKIPFSSFEGSFRGRDLPEEKLNPADIQRVGVILADKNAGPFRLEIDWIRTYGKGQGNYTERDPKPSSDAASPVVQPTFPGGPNGLIATMVKDGRFTVLKSALDHAGLTTFFQWDNKLTVMAPTDDAFAKLPEGKLEELLQPENKEKLAQLLSYHVVAGQHDLNPAVTSKELKSVEGSQLTVRQDGDQLKVNAALVSEAGIECSDGVIHALDRVLLP